jgi:hypothetical protein
MLPTINTAIINAILSSLVLVVPSLQSMFTKEPSKKWLKLNTFGKILLFFASIYFIWSLYTLFYDKPSNQQESIITATKDSLPPQQNINGNHNHIVNGNNSGVNGDVTIVNGIRQRRLTKKTLSLILSNIKKDTSTGILFLVPLNDKEATTYTNQIIDKLHTLGYKNTGVSSGMAYTGTDALFFRYDSINNTHLIVIPSVPDVR